MRASGLGGVSTPYVQSADDFIQRPTRTPSGSAGGYEKTCTTLRSAEQGSVWAFRAPRRTSTRQFLIRALTRHLGHRPRGCPRLPQCRIRRRCGPRQLVLRKECPDRTVHTHCRPRPSWRRVMAYSCTPSAVHTTLRRPSKHALGNAEGSEFSDGSSRRRYGRTEI